MADPIGFAIGYEQPFSPRSLRTLFGALREAVDENWSEHRDDLSFPQPTTPIEVEEWVDACAPEHLVPALSQGGIFRAEPLAFSYSPRSRYAAELFVFCKEDGRLDTLVSVSHGVTTERDSDREEWRRELEPDFELPWPGPADEGHMEFWTRRMATQARPWVHNRACLLRILDRLSSVFSVRRLQVDQIISEGIEPDW